MSWFCRVFVVLCFSPVCLPLSLLPHLILSPYVCVCVCLWAWQWCLQQQRGAPADHQLIYLCYSTLLSSPLQCQIVSLHMVIISVSLAIVFSSTSVFSSIEISLVSMLSVFFPCLDYFSCSCFVCLQCRTSSASPLCFLLHRLT